MTAEQEAEQKQKLIDELKGKMSENIESLIVFQQFSTQKTITENEFFQDNNKQLKQQAALIKRGREQEEKANEFFEEILPKLESTCESIENQDELTAEKIMNELVQEGPQGEIGRKIIKYQSKANAIQDALLALRQNQMELEDSLKLIRQLSKTQFRNQWKANRLIRYCQTGNV